VIRCRLAAAAFTDRGRIILNKRNLNGWAIVPGLAMLALACLPTQLPAQEFQLITAAGEKAVLKDPGTDRAGAAHADVTVVEYFDYNCPYCKKLVPALKALIAEDRKVAIVYKDWPILGSASKYAARSALAARWQGKYLVAHDALMSGPRLAKNDQVDGILRGAGVNIATLEKDRAAHTGEIDALLARNDGEAHALGLQGTPGVLVGRQMTYGMVDLGDLKKLVANSRHH